MIGTFSAVTLVASFVILSAGVASAATITTPSANPFTVPSDAAHVPVAFDVAASGYTPGGLVYVEQCDGVNPTTFGWSPTTDCDLGSSPSPAIADGSGNVSFPASNSNLAFAPFRGDSPQSLFNCLSPNGVDPGNGESSYTNCSLRVSSNNNAVTSDQAFVTMTLPEPATAPSAPSIGVAKAGSGAGSVSFDAPISNGGVPVLDYTATCVSSDGGATGSATAAASPITVTALTNGNTYECSVTARNAVGSGPASEMSNDFVPDPSPTVLSPNTNPFSAPGDASGNPLSFTVTASGYAPGSLVSVEQCDGVDPSTFGWSPTSDCDLGSSPAQATVDGSGNVTFPANDTNFGFTPFKGESPQSLFNCLGASDADPGNGLPSFTNCTLRVSTNNNAPTSDQVFVTLVLPEPATAPGAPTIGIGTAGNGVGSVTFTAPASNGGSAILDYTATCTSTDGGATGSATGATSPLTISALTNDKTYVCSVTARNAVGSGAASDISNEFTPTNTHSVLSPNTNPFVVPGDFSQNPVAFDVVASGYTPGTLVSVEQCDGVNPSTFGWSPTSDCDLGTSPAQATVADDGTVTFSAGDPNFAFTPFKGESPQSLFNCLSPNESDPNNGLPSFTNCTLRVSSNDNAPTADQVFVTLTLPETTPSAPTIGTAVAGNTFISVPFSPPASNGGAPILDYTATCISSNGGVTHNATKATSPITVLGLTNGKTYTCSVTARNGAGSGPASSASNAVVPKGAPGAPTAPAATPGNASATVHWTAPASNGGSAITGYLVTPFKAGVAQPVRTFNSTATSELVNALTNGVSYTFKVAAKNAIATGAQSVATAAVIPRTVPGAPTGVSALSASTTVATGSLTVTYTAPVSNGGSAITSYTATCTSSNGGVTKTGTHAGATAAAITVAAATTGKTYTCTVKATNVAGSSVASAASSAVIVGSPAKPTAVVAKSATATAATGSITVTFTLGANNGAAITSQTATCVSSNGGVTKTGTHTGATAAAITVAAVTTGKTYTCTVTAKNARGVGLASAASLPVIVGSPAPPTTVTAAHVAAGQIKVTFKIGANNGAAITKQTATCVSSNGGVTKTGTHTGATAAPITVIALTAGKSYTCTVTATNARGTGLASAPSNAATA